ncbi:ferredoxin [Streptomyces mashuensis]|uniref:Ferredoxin n=1 Tax=Streptomyces mashuensis TaxID=33904 RepID=A0A919ECJ1_9ACTN|nr:ferredoxin [Streptomyces mashuensis]GHF49833.1 ferredoxin [Streptomyces mashuensis]
MRVSIDSSVCIGSGMCALTAPSVFDQDDEGYGTVRPGRADGAGDPLVKEAVRACPVQAVRLDED